MRFVCPHCGTPYKVSEQAIGRRIRCPKCSEMVEVTAPPVPSPPAVPAAAATALVPPAPGVAIPAACPPIPQVAMQPAAVATLPETADTAEPPAEMQDVPVEERLPPRSRRLSLGRKGGSQEADMDMTPMVDVTFLLLIFFMVTASFTMQKSLNVPKPESDEPSTAAQSIQDFQENPDYVVVRIDSYNTYHLSAAAWDDEVEAPSELELLVKLRQARAGDSRGRVPTKMLVIASGGSTHERVVTAIDAGNDVGMEEVQLLTVEDDDP
ncbi:MAG: biopolymer transporter ExbD [Pirellulaceae bacterium]|nr:biopolymer transporter ExbD [Pirellulaceae bacterium]